MPLTDPHAMAVLRDIKQPQSGTGEDAVLGSFVQFTPMFMTPLVLPLTRALIVERHIPTASILELYTLQTSERVYKVNFIVTISGFKFENIILEMAAFVSGCIVEEE